MHSVGLGLAFLILFIATAHSEFRPFHSFPERRTVRGCCQSSHKSFTNLPNKYQNYSVRHPFQGTELNTFYFDEFVGFIFAEIEQTARHVWAEEEAFFLSRLQTALLASPEKSHGHAVTRS